MDADFYSKDVFVHILGNYLISVLNRDSTRYWFVFFKMLFAIEPGNNMEDFCLFLNVIKNYLVDNYWLNTSFVRLPMDQSDLLHEECARILGTPCVKSVQLNIIHDDKMVAYQQGVCPLYRGAGEPCDLLFRFHAVPQRLL